MIKCQADVIKIDNNHEVVFLPKNRDRNKETILNLVNNIDDALSQSWHFYKSSPGDTTTVGVVRVSDQHWVIKRYNFKNNLHALKLQLRKSHGARSFLFSLWLQKIRLPAIKPVAFIQKKSFFLKGRSYFVSEYEQGISGCHYFKDDSIFKNTWDITCHLIFSLIELMREHQIYHGDFHFGNLLIIGDEPKLLDFDRIKVIKNKNKFSRLHQKDLANFKRYLIRNHQALQFFKQHPNYNGFFN